MEYEQGGKSRAEYGERLLLESARSRKRRELFDAQDAIDAQRDQLIGGIEKQLSQRHEIKTVFSFRWKIT